MHNRLGPISETYNELQGVEALSAASSPGSLGLTPDTHLIRTLLQAFELVSLNLEQLSTRQLEVLDNPLPANLATALQHTIWHDAIMKIGNEIAAFAATHSEATANLGPFYDVPNQSSEYSNYVASYERLAGVLLELTTRKREVFERAIPNGTLADPIGHMCQALKNIRQAQRRSITLLRSIKAPRVDHVDYPSYVALHHIKEAFSKPTMSGDYYFTQFRLLHQIPELLGRHALARIKAASRAIEENDPPTTLEHLLVINRCVRILVQCLDPLVSLLMPWEYHQIRENLGQTSGSDSRVLAARLLKQDFVGLSKLLANYLDKNSASAHAKPLRFQLAELREQVISWREIHLALPRNVLGGFGTRSLIGAKDAVHSAQSMKQTFLRQEALSRGETAPPEDSFADSEHPSLADRLDNRLLEITSTKTKQRFKDVQERLNFFKPELRRKPDDNEDTPN